MNEYDEFLKNKNKSDSAFDNIVIPKMEEIGWFSKTTKFEKAPEILDSYAIIDSIVIEPGRAALGISYRVQFDMTYHSFSIRSKSKKAKNVEIDKLIHEFAEMTVPGVFSPGFNIQAYVVQGEVKLMAIAPWLDIFESMSNHEPVIRTNKWDGTKFRVVWWAWLIKENPNCIRIFPKGKHENN